MRDISKKLLNRYLILMQERLQGKIITINDLLNPSIDIVDEFQHILIVEVNDSARATTNNITEAVSQSIDADDDELSNECEIMFTKNVFLAYVDILEGIFLYLIFSHNSDDEKFLNELVQHSSDELTNMIIDDGDTSQRLILCYIKYLIFKSESLITNQEEEFIIENNRFLSYLADYKGYNTIADLLRSSIMDLYYDQLLTRGINRESFRVIDNLIYSDMLNMYFSQNGINTNDKGYLDGMKKYLVRLILADAYTDLKICSDNPSDDDDDQLLKSEMAALEYIEGCINSEEYLLPESEDVRFTIYRHFFDFSDNLSTSRKQEMEDLDEETHRKVMLLNPLLVFN